MDQWSPQTANKSDWQSVCLVGNKQTAVVLFDVVVRHVVSYEIELFVYR
jgi:hypothetical protein